MISINKESKKNDKYKIFLVFGLHAREMITVETGMFLLKNICKLGTEGDIDEG